MLIYSIIVRKEIILVNIEKLLYSALGAGGRRFESCHPDYRACKSLIYKLFLVLQAYIQAKFTLIFKSPFINKLLMLRKIN